MCVPNQSQRQQQQQQLEADTRCLNRIRESSIDSNDAETRNDELNDINAMCDHCGNPRFSRSCNNNNNTKCTNSQQPNNKNNCDTENIPYNCSCNSRLLINNPSSNENDVIEPQHSFCNGDTANRTAGGYLIAVHRKLSRQDTYFLSYHKSRPSLFGVPLLIPCYKNGTNKDLYCAVWVQVARLLSPLPSTPPDQSNHATDW